MNISLKCSAGPIFETPEGQEPFKCIAQFTFGASDPVECNAPVELVANSDCPKGRYNFNLYKQYAREVGVEAKQEFINSPVCVTIFKATIGEKQPTVTKVPIASATLDLSPFIVDPEAGLELGGEEVAIEALPWDTPDALPLFGFGPRDPPEDGSELPPPEPIKISLIAKLNRKMVTPEEIEKALIYSFKLTASPLPPAMLKVSADLQEPFNFTLGIRLDDRVAWCREGVITKNEQGEDQIVWDGGAVERFYMPPESAFAFKKRLRAGACTLYAQMGRYLKQARLPEFRDQFYEQYQACGTMTGLENLIEPGRSECECELPLLAFNNDNSTAPGPRESFLEPPVQTGKSPLPEDLTDRSVCPWVTVQTVVKVCVTGSRSLLPPWEAPPTSKFTINELLPLRPPPPSVSPKIVSKNEFRSQIKAAVATIADEFSAIKLDVQGDQKKTEKQLIFELNRRGVYFQLKEKIKRAVIDLVKDRYAKEAHTTKEEMVALYNDLYVHLSDEMHAVLHGIRRGEDPLSIPSKPKPGEASMADFTLDKLRMLADEYEVNFQFKEALKYHQQRVLKAPRDVSVWYDFGAYHMRRGELGEAEEAFREALLIDPEHVPSLVAAGITLLQLEEFDRCEVYLQTAMNVQKSNAIIWLLLCMLYALLGREKDCINCEWEMKRLAEETGQNVYLDASIMLLDHHVGSRAAQCLVEQEKTIDLLLCLSRAASIQNMHQVALDRILDALGMDNTDSRAYELLGHHHFSRRHHDAACEAYQKALFHAKGPCTLAVYLRLGDVYLQKSEYDKAKHLFLVACEACPCASTWLGAAISYFRTDDLERAERCLSEANLLDYLNPAVWGWLTLVCLKQGREEEAKQVYAQSQKHDLIDPSLLLEIGRSFFSVGWADYALLPLRKALSANPLDTVTRSLLAEALIIVNDLKGAKEELRRALEDASTQQDELNLLPLLVKVTGLLGEDAESQAWQEQLKAVQNDA